MSWYVGCRVSKQLKRGNARASPWVCLGTTLTMRGAFSAPDCPHCAREHRPTACRHFCDLLCALFAFSMAHSGSGNVGVEAAAPAPGSRKAARRRVNTSELRVAYLRHYTEGPASAPFTQYAFSVQVVEAPSPDDDTSPRQRRRAYVVYHRFSEFMTLSDKLYSSAREKRAATELVRAVERVRQRLPPRRSRPMQASVLSGTSSAVLAAPHITSPALRCFRTEGRAVRFRGTSCSAAQSVS